ncbi:hypothetical protein [Aidingimonas halophila]|uniref:Uncharacterized protein n=1 Tax=Aidingimonas halophila TaxID=574349 RepID=A0A1H2RG08_9GAMM|nr:hypothetical protein [Aidingimonas halophila]GHC19378.1 hypothetical protein GCM10008094_06730 [Aidingimonas halophila]SDW17754.1 hypothetical protein SAMN05443545_101299 [Aidingimonas halophila]
MARLKFTRIYDSGQEQCDVVECNHYNICRFAGGAVEVTTFPGYTDEGGVSRFVSSERDDGYPVCFVESDSTGKTVDVIRAGDQLAPE